MGSHRSRRVDGAALVAVRVCRVVCRFAALLPAHQSDHWRPVLVRCIDVVVEAAVRPPAVVCPVACRIRGNSVAEGDAQGRTRLVDAVRPALAPDARPHRFRAQLPPAGNAARRLQRQTATRPGARHERARRRLRGWHHRHLHSPGSFPLRRIVRSRLPARTGVARTRSGAS